MCLYPKLIKNRKYTETVKNGGIIPVAKDARVLLVPAGCGKCIECRKQKARNWTVRMQEEIRGDNKGKFVTLTFSPEAIKELNEDIETEEDGYYRDNAIVTLAVRRFLERWRKKYKVSVKHWLISEIGGKRYEGVHIHGIIFTENTEDIEKIWKYGYVYIGKYVNEASINYISKYILKSDAEHKEYTPKILTSKGIGKAYINKKESRRNNYKEGETIETYKARNGAEIALPAYYRNKIYTEEEREEMWLEKLDKNERYVMGEKISIKDTEKNYYEALEIARAKNKRLGYGSDEKDWKRSEYERKRRNLKQAEKINKALPPPEKGQC